MILSQKRCISPSLQGVSPTLLPITESPLLSLGQLHKNSVALSHYQSFIGQTSITQPQHTPTTVFHYSTHRDFLGEKASLAKVEDLGQTLLVSNEFFFVD